MTHMTRTMLHVYALFIDQEIHKNKDEFVYYIK